MKAPRLPVWRCLLLGIYFSLPFSAPAQIDWPQLQLVPVAGGLVQPIHIANAGDGSGRMFVSQKPGLISIVQSNAVLPQPFLNLTNKVWDIDDNGLLSMVFPTNFASKGYFYVYYSRTNDLASIISRFYVSSTNANVADPASEQILLVMTKQYSTLDGGQLAFGPDGYLYIGTGDDVYEPLVDPPLVQLSNSFWGKILRIDTENSTNSYLVPPSNPFVGNPAYLPEIWAVGFRNPWRFSFDRLTGDLYVGDVGEESWEEVDVQPVGTPGGRNYGWRWFEGFHPFDPLPPNVDTNSLTFPVAEYAHGTNGLSAITGGFVYRGPGFPRLQGVYIMGDSSTGQIRGLKRDGTNWVIVPLLAAPPGIVSFGQDQAGNLYAANLYQGTILQVVDGGAANPPIFDPPGGTSTTELITVNSLSTNVTIHYTTNGMDPTTNDPVVTAGSTVTVATGATLKARAYRADLLPSAVSSATYILQAAKPVFNPPLGPLTNGQLITITSVTSNAVIRYTLDGTTPAASSPVYSGPVDIHTINVLTAVATRSGFADSLPAQSSYGFLIQTQALLPNRSYQFGWTGLNGRVYQVQSSPGLSQWTNIGNPQTGNGGTLFFTNIAGPTQLYRISAH